MCVYMESIVHKKKKKKNVISTDSVDHTYMYIHVRLSLELMCVATYFLCPDMMVTREEEEEAPSYQEENKNSSIK